MEYDYYNLIYIIILIYYYIDLPIKMSMCLIYLNYQFISTNLLMGSCTSSHGIYYKINDILINYRRMFQPHIQNNNNNNNN
jgi:hypothetical protein